MHTMQTRHSCLLALASPSPLGSCIVTHYQSAHICGQVPSIGNSPVGSRPVCEEGQREVKQLARRPGGHREGRNLPHIPCACF